MASIQRKIHIPSIILGMFLASSVFGYFYVYTEQEGTKIPKEHQRDTSKRYQYISPLLECENTSTTEIRKYIPFEKGLKEKILNYQQKYHPSTRLSFYFRDLRNGPWISHNHTEGYYPASLFKIPTLLAYVRWAELDSSILSKKIKIEDSNTYTQNISPERNAKVGEEYTVEELLELMVLYSDNTASNNLLSHLPLSLEEDIFQTLQIPSPNNISSEQYKVTVRDYASFFRILYNASYLSDTSSEAVLDLLTQVTFNRGIRGKLPSDIKIAHKFGERLYYETQKNGTTVEKVQLHDCGIVYYPENPYLLCIMSEGADLGQLSELVQEVSKITFDTYISARKKVE